MMEFHELANVFPLLEGAQFDDLVASIRANGQYEPIITYQGMILDGRNRYRACLKAGVEPYFGDTRFDGTFEEARDFVIASNLRRRHLDASQRAMIGAQLANMRQGARTDLEPSANLQKVDQSKAAEMLNVSPRSVASAREVIDHGAPELVQAVERGQVAVSTAAKVAKLPQSDQVAEMERIAERRPPIADPKTGSTGAPSARPLHNLYNIAGGELARWVKITTPNDRPHIIRELQMCTDILRDEFDAEQQMKGNCG
jgi:ParB-like chromosome segregation protein Spo0J